MKDSPSISIIMNCYNGEKYLKNALKSIIEQSYKSWELIFWDNNSTDRSAQIFKSFKRPNQFKYFYDSTHRNLYDARNYAVKEASGEFIAFLDVDDWWHSNKLEEQIKLFADPEVGIVCSNYWMINELKENKKYLRYKRPIKKGWVLEDLLTDYKPGLLSLVLRSSAIKTQNHIFNPSFNVIGDMDLIVRLSVRWKLDYIHKPLAFCRLHYFNTSNINQSKNIEEINLWFRELKKIDEIKKNPYLKHIEGLVYYLKAKESINNGFRLRSLKDINKIPSNIKKIKILAFFFLSFFNLKLFFKIKKNKIFEIK